MEGRSQARENHEALAHIDFLRFHDEEEVNSRWKSCIYIPDGEELCNLLSQHCHHSVQQSN